MRNILSALCIIILMVSAIGCSKKSNPENNPLPVIAPSSELKITSSDHLVDEFLGKNKDFTDGYQKDDCFNITPDFISNNSSYSIFKYKSSTASFLMYEDEIFPLGIYIGGYGVTSMALADLDSDNVYELYFTFSYGSGLHRSQIGYFQPSTRTIHIFDYSHLNKDMILTTNEAGDLLVNDAEFDMDEISFVNFTLKATESLGSINFENDNITLKLLEEK